MFSLRSLFPCSETRDSTLKTNENKRNIIHYITAHYNRHYFISIYIISFFIIFLAPYWRPMGLFLYFCKNKNTTMNKIEHRSTDNPKLKEKKMTDGQSSLYLEYYFGYEKSIDPKTGKELIKKRRQKKTLGLYLYDKPRDSMQREHNKRTLSEAQARRMEEELKLKGKMPGRTLLETSQKDFLTLFQIYNDNYNKKDYRMMKGALTRFKDFLNEKYPIYKTRIMPEQLTKEMIEQFVLYLQSRSKGEGASDYYQHFKKVIKYLYDNDIIRKNPCTGVICKVDKTVLRKPVLSEDEIKTLINTTYPEQSQTIRNAFLFCLLTGVRFCDVVDLKFSDIDYSNRWIQFEQNKTKGHSNTSGVTINLTSNIQQLIGAPQLDKEGNIIDDYIFKLPTYNACCKALKRWCKRAGITKNITWHVASHSDFSFWLKYRHLQVLVT